MRSWVILALLGAAISIPSAAEVGAERADLSGITSWAIQLQEVDLAEMEAADVDLVVRR